MSHVAIVGAGISGLATAFELRRLAEADGAPLKLTVVEELQEVGGKVRTEATDGYLCETGVQAFLDNSPPTLELASALGLDPALRRASPAAKKRWVYADGRLHELPDGPGRLLRSGLLSWGGKLRLAMEPLARRRPPGIDETVADFARRRLGDEALERLIGPMVSGVFAGDPEHLSIASAFPKVVALEERYGGLIRGMLALRRERGQAVGAGPGGTLTSFAEGMRTPCHALAAHLGDVVVTGQAVTAMRRTGSGWSLQVGGGDLAADAVVLAVPAYVQARLLGPLDAEMGDLLDLVPYPPLTVVCLGYRRGDVPHPLDGFGFLVPRREPVHLLGALFESTLFEDRAPSGHVLLRVMIGGATNPELCALPEEELLRLLCDELRQLLGITAEPAFTRSWHHPQAIPQYPVGHRRRVEDLVGRAARLGHLVLTGNAYRGISFNDCIRNARETAQEARRSLGWR